MDEAAGQWIEQVVAATAPPARRRLARAYDGSAELLQFICDQASERQFEDGGARARVARFAAAAAWLRGWPGLLAEALWMLRVIANVGADPVRVDRLRERLYRLRAACLVPPWHPAWNARRRVNDLSGQSLRALMSGDLEAAWWCLERARSITADLPEEQARAFAPILLAREASLRFDAGEVDQATALLQQLVDLPIDVHKTERTHLQVLHTLCVAWLRVGRYRDALAALPSVVAGFERIGESAKALQAHADLTTAEQTVGHWPAALQRTKELLSQIDANRPSDLRIVVHLSAASLFLYLGVWSEALAQALAGEQAAAALGHRRTVAEAQLLAAWAYVGLGNMPRAARSFESSLETFRAVGARDIEMEPLVGLAHVYLVEERYVAAEEAAQEAEKFATERGARRSVFQAHLMRARVAAAVGEWEDARVLAQECLVHAQEERKANLAVEAHDLLAQIDEQQGAYRQALRHALRGIRLHERVRLGLEDRLIQAAVHVRRDGLYQRALRLVLDHRVLSESRSAPIGLLLSEAGRARTLRDELHGRDVAPVPSKLTPVLAHVPEDQAILYYMVSEGHLRVFLLRSGKLHVRNQPVQRDHVLALLQRLVFQLARPDVERMSEVGADGVLRRSADDVLAEAHDLFVGPEREHLRGVQRLVVIPHETLWCVPFLALAPREGRALIDDHEVVCAPSLGAYLEQIERRPPRPGSALAVGVSDERAPHVEEEARAVAARLDGIALVGPEATRKAVCEHARDISVLHLAGHTAYARGKGNVDRMRLADGWLDEALVSKIDAHPDLVVLSGCSTADGWIREVGDLFGILRSFLVLRAQSIVASLWTLHDERALETMRHFYEVWRKERSAPAALRAAVLAMRAEHPHPYYWATFVCFTRLPDPSEPASTS